MNNLALGIKPVEEKQCESVNRNKNKLLPINHLTFGSTIRSGSSHGALGVRASPCTQVYGQSDPSFIDNFMHILVTL